MIRGGCLCGAVRFEVTEVCGPFELCHCRRCRRVSGSAFMAAVGVKREGFRFTSGEDWIRTFDAPILEAPPAYRTSFCGRCGSPVPGPAADSEWLEVPAGLFDEDPGLKPDKHIFVEKKAPWYEIRDSLPQYDAVSLRRLRSSKP